MKQFNGFGRKLIVKNSFYTKKSVDTYDAILYNVLNYVYLMKVIDGSRIY